MGKKKISTVAKAAATKSAGNQVFSPEIQIANLKALNSILLKNTVDHREEINDLHSKVDSLGTEKDAIQSDLDSKMKDLRDLEEKIQFSRERIEDEMNLKAEEAVALRMQLNDSIQNLEILQKKLDYQIRQNEETKKHMNSLMVEKASLEQQFETSNQGLEDVEKKLKLLQLSVASSNSKMGKLDWFISATTFIVAASLAYKGGRN